MGSKSEWPKARCSKIATTPARKIAALVQYAKLVGATVVAEGIETEPESQVVCDLGVDLLQGFLYSRPTEHPSL